MRPLLNHLLTTLCLGLLLADCILYEDPSYESIRVHSPVVIFLLLGVVLATAAYRTIVDIKAAYELYKIKTVNDENGCAAEDTPEKKADLQFSLLAKQLFHENPIA